MKTTILNVKASNGLTVRCEKDRFSFLPLERRKDAITIQPKKDKIPEGLTEENN